MTPSLRHVGALVSYAVVLALLTAAVIGMCGGEPDAPILAPAAVVVGGAE